MAMIKHNRINIRKTISKSITKKIYTWHHANIYLKVSASPDDSSESYALYSEEAMHQRRLNAPKPIDFEGVGVHSMCIHIALIQGI